MQIHIDRIQAENFLQFPFLDIFLTNQGRVFLGGELGHNQKRSNSAGKTGLISVLPYTIWGRILRELRDISRVIHYDAASCMTRVEGRIDTIPFWIERRRSKKGDPEIRTSFTGSSRGPDIQAEINQTFGSFELAQNTVFLAQRKALEFLSATDAKRRELLEDLLKIGVWRKKLELVKQDIAWAEESTLQLETELKDAQSQLTLIRIKQEHTYELELSELQTQRRALSERIKEETVHWEKLSREHCLVNKQQVTTARDLEDAQATLSKVLAMRMMGERHQAKLKSKIEDLGESEKSLKAKVCPTCNRPLESRISLKDKIQELQEELEKNQQTLADWERDRVDCEALVAIRKNADDKLRGEQHGLSKSTRDISRSLAGMRNERDMLDNDIQIVKDAANVNDDEEITECNRIIETRTRMLEEIKQSTVILQECKSAFSYKGIPAMRIAHTLPKLVQETNKALTVLSDQELRLDILPGDITKGGNILERLTFLVDKLGRTVYLEDCSAGEQRRIVVALFLGLLSIQRITSGRFWTTCFIDELFDELDQPGIEAAMRVLMNIPDMSTIIVTSHRSELSELGGFDRRWVVRRDGDNSRLIIS